MVTTVLAPDAVVLGNRVATGARVRVRDGRILEVGACADEGQVEPVTGTLLPGLIDLQCNGAGGHSVDEATPAALDAIAAAVWMGGAVAFLPTLVTAPFETLLDQLARAASWIESGPTGGARPLGIHLEGPFLAAMGTHEGELFVDPTPERVDAILAAARGHLAMVTIAPSRPGAAEATARLREADVAVALGHDEAAGAMTACVDAGARMVTHLFNAMGPIHHREPGLAGHALDEERVLCSLIPDGAHVHPVMVRNVFRCLGPERSVLVTDSVAAAGMPDGEYPLQGRTVRAENGVVRDTQGRLAGSALTMSDAARTWLGIVPDTDAETLATVAAANPARALGDGTLGAIEPGREALFSVLDRENRVHCLRP